MKHLPVEVNWQCWLIDLLSGDLLDAAFVWSMLGGGSTITIATGVDVLRAAARWTGAAPAAPPWPRRSRAPG